ncbi:MAG: hypothetical protein ACRCT8_12140 [Lacipirellulaceae bacterium]
MAIGELAVNVTARTHKARKDLGLVRGEVRGLGTSVRGTMRSLAPFAATLAGGIGATMGARALLRTADSLDRVGDVAAKLDVPTEKLMGLHHAAQMTGNTGEIIDTALQRMALSTNAAADGTIKAQKSLEALGIDAAAIAKLPLDQRFYAIAEATKAVEDPTKKLSIATGVFGRQGGELVRTLDLGAGGLRKMQTEAQALGQALSSEDIAKVAEFNDALDKLKAAGGGLVNEIVISVAPGAMDFANGLTEAIRGFKEIFGQGGEKKAPLKAGERRNAPLGSSVLSDIENDPITGFYRRLFDGIAGDGTQHFGPRRGGSTPMGPGMRGYRDPRTRTTGTPMGPGMRGYRDPATAATAQNTRETNRLLGELVRRGRNQPAMAIPES